ncbi:MAG: hypothetical protein OEW21_00145 [Betaproteobacteria bacterium]|nr:hypothetical protein [Betaproteobacteria bacterium]
MRHYNRFVFTLGATAALLFCTATATATASSPSYEQGLEAAREYRYSLALTHFTVAAEHGDQDAQRSLGLMLLHGERLYGREVRRDEEQAKRWLRAAAAQGCAISSHILKKLAKHAN